MIYFKNWFVMFLLFFAGSVSAIQEDVNPILRKPNFLFSGSKKNEIIFLSAKTFKAGFDAYVYLTDENHAWQFKSAGDIGVLSVGSNMLWRASLEIEALADNGKTSSGLDFRLRQSGYDVSTAYEFLHNKTNVFSIGWRHRCRHGSDHTTDQGIPAELYTTSDFQSRIVMRSGLEASYNALYTVGNWQFINNNLVNLYLVGQNIVTEFQPRMMASSVLQVEYPFSDFVLFGSSGLGISWITSSSEKFYNLFTKRTGESKFRMSPASAFGIIIPGSVGDFRVFASYTSNIDTAFRKVTDPAHFAMISAEFWL
ncbi:MAG: hypothetical protein O2897_01415 [bacterium]|nr:hypothetical protein [bacterium]